MNLEACGMVKSVVRTAAGVFVVCLMLAFAAASVSAQSTRSGEAALWAALKAGEAFAIMRHALAPGVGDPDDFSVDDCATQRNLSADGRAQARAIGERFGRNGIDQARVYSSAWCRCKDTATLLGLGKVEVLEPLNSFFQDYDRRAPQTNDLKAWLATAPLSPPLVLVTHQVNISALTGRPTRSGEVLVVKRYDGGRFEVLGSLAD